jgi:hypothetical protein
MRNDVKKVIRHSIRNYEEFLMKAGGLRGGCNPPSKGYITDTNV